MKLPKKAKKTWKDYLRIIIALLLISGGLYLLFVSISPFLASQMINPEDNSTTRLLAKTAAENVDHFPENRLYIPAIDVNILYETGGPEVLELAAWWRHPESGNPKDGGNFIIAAHRFQIGPTPQRTLNNSPFYNINRLKLGDSITVDFDGKRYEYTISDIFRVKPEDTHIEARTDQPRLTLYSCTLGGSFDGREVIIATPKSE